MRVIDLHAHVTPQRFQAAIRTQGTWHGLTSRTGELEVNDATQALDVSPDEVARWVASRARTVSVADVLASPAERRLTRRAERLVALIAEADGIIRGLTGMLDAECKKFGRFAQLGSHP